MPIHLPHPDTAKRQRTRIREISSCLTDHKIDWYLNRARYAAVDAYSGSTGGRGNDVSRPTEAAVVRDAGGRILEDEHGNDVATDDNWEAPADPVREHIAELFALLAEAAGISARIDKLSQYLDNDHSRAATRQSSLAGDCGRCGTTVTGAPKDKLVSGYCSRCRKAWERAGYPDRLKFERDYQTMHGDADQALENDEWDPARNLGADQYEATTAGGS
jgi:hypothetical protein